MSFASFMTLMFVAVSSKDYEKDGSGKNIEGSGKINWRKATPKIPKAIATALLFALINEFTEGAIFSEYRRWERKR